MILNLKKGLHYGLITFLYYACLDYFISEFLIQWVLIRNFLELILTQYTEYANFMIFSKDLKFKRPKLLAFGKF